MAKKTLIEALYLLLNDLMKNNILFGGKVIIFDEDFRQTFSIVHNSKKEYFIHESLLNFKI